MTFGIARSMGAAADFVGEFTPALRPAPSHGTAPLRRCRNNKPLCYFDVSRSDTWGVVEAKPNRHQEKFSVRLKNVRPALPRNEMMGIADPHLSDRVLIALDNAVTDWRTVASLAEELNVNEEQMRKALRVLGDQVRRPIGQEKRYPDWYRLASRGYTRQEKWARLKAIVTSTSMDDDF